MSFLLGGGRLIPTHSCLLSQSNFCKGPNPPPRGQIFDLIPLTLLCRPPWDWRFSTKRIPFRRPAEGYTLDPHICANTIFDHFKRAQPRPQRRICKPLLSRHAAPHHPLHQSSLVAALQHVNNQQVLGSLQNKGPKVFPCVECLSSVQNSVFPQTKSFWRVRGRKVNAYQSLQKYKENRRKSEAPLAPFNIKQLKL